MESTIYLDCYKLICCKSRLKPIRRSGDLPDKLLKQRKRGRLNAVSDDLLSFCLFVFYLLLSGGVAVFQNIQDIFQAGGIKLTGRGGVSCRAKCDGGAEG